MPLRFIDNAAFTSRVGIGTNNPTSPLHVFNAGYPQMALESNGGTWQVGVSTGNDLAFRRGTSGSNYPLWLDSSDNVGIGTTSPSEKLHVDGNAIVSGIGVGTSTLYSNSINITNSGTLRIGNTEFLSKSSNDLSIYQQKINVTSAGNVGVGTTSPAEKLTVSGDANITGKLAVGSSAAHPSFAFYNQLNAYFNGAVTIDDTLTQSGGGTSSFSGNVGIGTTSPANKLTVRTSTINDGLYLETSQPVTYGKIYNSNSESFPVGNLNLAYGTNSTAIIQALSNRMSLKGGYTTGGQISFLSASTEIMRMTSTGLGIGTTSPNSGMKLEVVGNIRTNVSNGKGFAITGTTGVTSGLVRSDGTGVALRTSDTDRVTVDLNGNVGIGTTNPTAPLSISNSSSETLEFNNSISSQSRILSYNRSNNSYRDLVLDGLDIIFKRQSSEAMRITSNGNVGIGTTTPGSVLHVQQDKVTLNTTNLDNGTAVGLHLTYPDTSLSGGEGIALAMGMNGRGRSYIANLSASTNKDSSDMLFYTENGGVIGERVRINNSGKVGIGTTNPGYKLEISDDTDTTVNLLRLRNADSLYSQTWDFQLDTGKHLVVTGGSGSGGIVLKPGSAGLNVTSTSAAQIFLNSATGNDSVLNFHENSSQKGKIGYDTSLSGIALVAGSGAFSSADMVVLDNGNVGIGTTSPGVKLDVTGQIRASSGLEISGGNINLVDNSRIRLGSSVDFQIYHDGSNSYITDTGTGDLYIRGSNSVYIGNNAGTKTYISGTDGGATKLYYNGAGAQQKLETTSTGVSVTGTATATTFSGDLNGTINTATTAVTKANATNDTTVATTAFVQNLIGTIPAGLVFQGTWDAATNTPTLTSGLGTTGHFYIVSTDGSTNLDGITDWKVGDWAVFVEQGATDAWEKVDNSSVLDGSGTGQKVALWSGSGTSNTLTDAPITVSGNNVGIGTTSPSQTLSVEGNIELGTGGYIYGDTTTPYLRLNNAAGAFLGYSTSYVTVGGPTTVVDAGTYVARFRSNKVIFTQPLFVGTSNINDTPTAELQVKGAGTTSATTALLVQNSATTELFRVRDDGSVYGTGGSGVDTNAAYGKDALVGNTAGTFNTAVGTNSLENNTASFNTGIGAYALNSNTSGTNNVAVGINSLRLNISGSTNTAVGREALYSNTSSDNTSVGYQALYTNTTGIRNVAVGKSALTLNSTGQDNVAVGESALFYNTSSFNTALGKDALYFNTTGSSNTSSGYRALRSNTTGSDNTALGADALVLNSTGSKNTGLGHDVLRNNTASYNTAVGDQAAYNNTTGTSNVAVGQASLYTNTTGNNNTAIGRLAIFSNSTGLNNTSIGMQSLYNNTTANNNSALGFQALYSNQTGGNNVAIGYGALFTNVTGNNNIAIGVEALINSTAPNNTAIGYQALLSNTTGTSNVALGLQSLKINTTGSNNVALGYQSLHINLASNNTAVGHQTLLDNTTGAALVALGYRALYNNTTGSNNTALGHLSLFYNTIGSSNVAIGTSTLENNTASRNTAVGYAAMFANITGTLNVALGYHALRDNTANLNTAVGNEALKDNTTGQQSVALGSYALANNTTAGFNTAVGGSAMFINTTGTGNVALGYQSLYSNTTSNDNTAIGSLALRNNTIGANNTAVGRQSLNLNTTGNFNTALGRTSLYVNTTGSSNTAVGYDSLRNNTESNNTALGYQAGYETGNLTGTSNTFLGYNASYGTATTITNSTAVGANVTLTNSNTVILGNNANVGIGTTNPNDATVIKTNTDGKGLTLQRNSTTPGTYSQLGFYQSTNDAGSANVWIRGYRETAFADNYMTFGTNSSEKMRITPAGNVGIGTTIPSRKLSVYQGSSSMVADFRSASGNDSFISFSNNASTADQVRLGSSSGNLILSTNYTERMRITSTGNVGIGTTSPSDKLHIEGDSTPTIKIVDTTNTTITELYSNNFDTYLANESSGRVFIRTGGSNGFVVNSSGNVGIGTTNPGQKLHVQTTSGVTARFAYDSNNYQDLNWEGSNIVGGSHTFKIAGSEKMRIHSNGNVGIGTTTPGTPLDVTGAGRFSGFVRSNFLNTYNNSKSIIGAPSNYVSIYDGLGTEAIRIDSSGNVGIGTTSPSEKLHVAGTIATNNKLYFTDNTAQIQVGSTWNTGKLQFLNGTTAYLEFDVPNGRVRNNLGKYVTASNSVGKFGTMDNFATTFVVNDSEKVRIDTSGNVGIGTTTPGEKLVVQDGKVSAGHTNTKGYGFHDLSNYAYTANTGRLSLVSNGIEAVSVDSSQRVGIGTTSPTEKLHVSGNVKGNDFFGNLFSVGNEGKVVSTSSLGLQLQATAGSKPITFFTNVGGNTERMRITSGGNVGIGTTSPDVKLHVSGNAKTTNIYVADSIIHTDDTNNYFKFTTDTQIFATSGAERMRINSSGNVGIGTTGPSNRLQVTGGSIGIDSQYAIRDNRNNTILQQSANTAASNRTLTLGNATYSNIIIPNGNVGIGTTSPSQKLDVVGSAQVSGQTHTGTLRVDATAAGPNPAPNQSPSDAIVRTAGDTAIYLSEPDEWLEININGINYVIPAYLA